MKQQTTAPPAAPTRYRPGKIWEESTSFGDYLRRMAEADPDTEKEKQSEETR